MTHNVTPSLARMLTYAIDNELPEKIEGWKAKLAEAEVTDDMIATFHGFGWLSSKHDPRITFDAETAPEPTPEPTSVTTGGEASPTGDVLTTPRRRGVPPPPPPERD